MASCACLSSSDALLYFHKGSGQQCTTEKQVEKYILYISGAAEATYEWSGLSKVEFARAEKVCLINIHKHFLACVTSTLAIIFGI